MILTDWVVSEAVTGPTVKGAAVVIRAVALAKIIGLAVRSALAASLLRPGVPKIILSLIEKFLNVTFEPEATKLPVVKI